MPSPPLSPSPRRWRGSPDQPHPAFAALLSSFEAPSSSGHSRAPSSDVSVPDWATARGQSDDKDEDDEAQVENLTTTRSPDTRDKEGESHTPEIRTTSPSPQRLPQSASASGSHFGSPLLPPNRGQLFGEDTSSTIGRSGLGPRGLLSDDSFRSQPSFDTSSTDTPAATIPPQVTGQSVATIDAAYDGVLSQLDALANPPHLGHPTTQDSLSRYVPPAAFQPMPIRQPLVGLGIRMGDTAHPSPSPAGGEFALSRLSTVTERTERSHSSPSNASNHERSPTFPGAYKEGPPASPTTHSSIAGKYPLPPSPVKGPRAFGTVTAPSSSAGTPQGTPKKTSDLIKMFEGRGGGAPPPQPQFTPTSPSKKDTPARSSTVSGVPPPAFESPRPGAPSSVAGASKLESVFNPPPPPSSFTRPTGYPGSAPTPPPKSPSPLSQVRTMIASWRARSGTPSQRVVGSPGKGGDSPRLFRSGDKGWNVSIRRRKRHERELAEQADDRGQEQEGHWEQRAEEQKEDETPHSERGGDEPPSRSASIKSEKKAASEPKQLTGDPIRTGALYYLHVHEDEVKPNYRWVQADGRLYPEGLELTWISDKGKATVTLDLEFCDEVASTYSPNNPMAGDDIGAAAAKRQGQLADTLYPFKLVYDDGVERLACDSARDRVRWVNAIWTVLEHTRVAPSASLRANRSSSDHGSEAGGSASTHFTPAESNKPLPSPHPSGSHPLYTTDDAVIETSGGLHAPIVQRGSRRLAVPPAGLERTKSLRRVASEADLKESANTPPPPEKDEDIPLTAQTAERPVSRDFTFAHGIKPPTLKDEFFSSSEGTSSFQTPATGYQSLAGFSQHPAPSSYATATPAGSAQPLSSPSRYTNARSEIASTPATTAQVLSSPSRYTTAQSEIAATPTTTAQPLSTMSASAYTAPSGPGSTAPYHSAREMSSGQSMYTVPTPATTARGFTSEPTYTARPGSHSPAGTARDIPSSPSMYTAAPGSQTPMTTARGFSDLPTATTAPPGSYTSQSTAQPWTSSISPRTAKGPATEVGTADVFSPSASSHTARPGSHTPAATVQEFTSGSGSSYTAVAGPSTEAPMTTVQPFSHTSAYTPAPVQTPAGTAQPFTSTASMHTPRGPSPAAIARSVPYTPDRGVPEVAITGASPNAPTDASGTAQGTSMTQPFASATATATGTQSYLTAGNSAYTNAPGSLGSPFQTPQPPVDRDRASSRMSRSSASASTYQTVPPPVPSRDSHYSTASPGTTSTKAPSTAPSSPTRYQLHDAPVPSYAGSAREESIYPTATQGDRSFITPQNPTTVYGTADDANPQASVYHDRPPTTRYATATTDPRWTGSMGTAPTTPSRSPRSSDWNTAPPPPISRTASSEAPSSTRLTDGLGTRRGSRAWTQVSHPDSDDELLADLERRSSNGSTVSRKTRSKVATADTPSHTMFTAQTFDKSARTPLGTARENTLYNTARESAYTTAPSWQTQSTCYATVPSATSFYTARTAQTMPIRAEQHVTVVAPPSLSSEKPAESSTEVSSAPPKKIQRVPPPIIPVQPRIPTPVMPVRVLPPPSPSFPSSIPGTSEPSSSSAVSSSTATALPRDVATGSDVNRLLNFLQGQEQSKQGQTTRLGNQLDRIERKVTQIAENQSAMAERDRPPPLPSKNDDESPPSSPTSTTSSASSTETARPVTPPPVIIPEVINQQFDDLRNLLGTLIGRQEDLLGRQDDLAQEMARRRSFDIELPERGPGMARLEDLLKRVLQRVGDSEFADELLHPGREEKTMYPRSHLSTPKTAGTREGSMYEGGDSVYSGESNGRGRHAPPNSISSSFERRRRGPLGEVPESLIDGEIPSPEFDEDFALSGLPPDTPPEEFIARQRQIPPHLARRVPRRTPAPQPQPQMVPQPMPVYDEMPQEEYYDEEPEYDEPEPEYEREQEPEPEPEQEPEPEPEPMTEYEPTPPPAHREMTPRGTPVQPPVPYRTEESYPDDEGAYEHDPNTRGPYRQGPPPQPVNLPTPVNSPRNMPPYQPAPQSNGMRPGFAPAPGMPAPPMGPGMTDMPRPSLPRIAGVRDPISTTYFRRGFPPGPMGPMGPMGMFPGPMGIPGPGMGPFMPGLRPGMPGFGGPIGPNVNPSLRRPGFFPPGVTSTTGDYGLPAAARYGNAGLPPSGPTVPGMPPRPPSGQTTTADTGLGNTTTESTVSTPATTSTPSSLSEEIVTPVAPTTVLQEPIHIPTTAELPPVPLSASAFASTDDSFRRALGNTEALAAAQGEQQNEMSRYLHGMSDQIADGTLATQNQLAEILGDISALRQQLKPKHVHAHVLADGTVMLDNGDIVDGIRGAPAPVPPGVPPPPPPPVTASHVEGRILPDGTVMVGGKIVDGIKGAPSVASPATPMTVLDEAVEEEQVKNAEQDSKLAELQAKIEELMQRTAPQPPPQRIFEEEEIISMKADTDSPAPAMTTPGQTIAPTPALTNIATPGPTPGMPPTVMGTPAPTAVPSMGVAPTVVGPHTDIRREKQVIKEREVIREGPVNRQKEVTIVDELERDMVTEVPAGTGTVPPGTTLPGTLPPPTVVVSVAPPPTAAPDTVIGTPAPAGSGGLADVPGTATGTSQPPPPTTVPLPISVPTDAGTATVPAPTAAPASSRVNPRTGKPLILPPLLSAHSMSPIQTDYNDGHTTGQLVREEHEEIIQRPGGGPPVVTQTTTRTYLPGSGAPAATAPPATVMGDAPTAPGSFGPPASVHPSAAGPPPKTVGPSASVHPSASKAATTAPPPATVFADPAGPPAMPTIAPGAHTSDHQSVVQQPPPNIPTVKSTHEAEVVAPGPVPIDSKNTSVSQTQQPPKTVANPSAVAPPGPAAPTIAPLPAPGTAGVASAPPAAASNVPPAAGSAPPASKPVFDTNHPKSPKSQAPSVVANVPSAPAPDAAPPSTVANVPTGGDPAPAVPAGGVVSAPPASLPADAAGPTKSPSSKGKSAVHWDSIIPSKEVSAGAPKSPKSKATTVGDAPGAAPALPSASELHNVPMVSEPGGAIVIPPEAQRGAMTPGALPGSTETNAKDKTSSGPLSGILKKPQSKESLKTTTPPPAGVPLVPADTKAHPDHSTVGKPVATQGSDKATRVADTAHPPGETIHVPGTPAQATSAGSSKLRKKPPTFIEGDVADPSQVLHGIPVGSAAGPPSRAGTPCPAPPSRAGTPGPGAGPASSKGAPAKDIPVLEEVLLPDGRTAYVPSRPVSQAKVPPAGIPSDAAPPPPAAGTRPPSTLKKGKSPSPGAGDGVDETHTTQKDTAKTKTHVPAESQMGQGHCSVCCPHGPRTHGGVPIEPCEHQDGILGPMAKAPTGPSGPRSNKSAKGSKPASLGLPEPAHPAVPEEVNIEDVEGDVVMGDKAKSGPPSKLTKGKKTGSFTPEEEAMEDARKLAVKQKAAAEQAAAEKADRDAKAAEKAAKAKLAEERHRQNAEALANLQKALDAIAAEGKAAKTMNDEHTKAQEKRRGDKTVRDKKITEALEKLVAERDEAKKKQAADDKKPGTQAVLDALKTAGDGQAAFLRKLATEIMDQNSNQHQLTQQAAKGAAREQIGFNLAGYLDDFSKALSGEVRVLLKEVGDLRESRRALYMELAELLLMKGRQSAGDLMAILPYPSAPPKNPANQPKKEEKKDGGQNQQNQQKQQGKAPAGVPAWASWQPMGIPPVMGRPLPQPGGPPPMMMNLGGGAVPPPPPPHGRPLPQP